MRRSLPTAGATVLGFSVLLLVAVLEACGGSGAGNGGSGGIGGAVGRGGRGSPGSGGGAGGAGHQPTPLTPEEVTGLAPGDAGGRAYAGTFTSDIWGPNLCSCRTGSCQDFPYNVLAIVEFSQTDGSLSMERVRGSFRETMCTGGVDQTGQFWCGVGTGGNLFLMKGQFSTTGGLLTSMSMTARETVRGDDGLGNLVDCDLEQSETFQFLQ